MKYLGIDFGSKRVGLATSDESGKIAFPLSVIPNDSGLMAEIQKICGDKKIEGIVMGESKNFKNEPNRIMDKIVAFKSELEKELKMPVALEPEFMSSAGAEKLQGDPTMLDASAAAIILQSFLDRAGAKVPVVVIKPKISIDDFTKVEISAGKILSAEKVPDADKLLKLAVDFGEEKPRQIISGIALHYPDPAVLVGKTVMFVTNLEPRTIRGYESNGMILAVQSEGGLALLEPTKPVGLGAKAK